MVISRLFRKLLSTRDERGRATSDRFRLAARKAVRDMVVDVTGRILDCGGADGLLFDPRISGLNSVVTVLDLDERALKTGLCAYSGTGSFVCGDMTRMPFGDGTFDTAVCIGTFYNFPSKAMVRRGIGEMARVSGEGGRIVLEFRNADNPVVSMAYRHAESYDPSLNGLPLNAYRLSEVRDMLKKLDLEIRAVKYIGIPIKLLAIGFVIMAGGQDGER